MPLFKVWGEDKLNKKFLVTENFAELVSTVCFACLEDLTLFEALTGGAFDRVNWQHSEEFDQNFSKKSNAQGFARVLGGGGAWAVLELTGTLPDNVNAPIKTDRQTDMFLFGVLYKESTLTAIPNS